MLDQIKRLVVTIQAQRGRLLGRSTWVVLDHDKRRTARGRVFNVITNLMGGQVHLQALRYYLQFDHQELRI